MTSANVKLNVIQSNLLTLFEATTTRKAMSIDQNRVVDFIGMDLIKNEIILTISDHLEWGVTDHLVKLQEKLNNYLSFIESGELYEAYHTRASDRGPHAGQWDNGQVMERILALRHELAQLLGFANYAERSLAKKMARTPPQVMTFLEDVVGCRWWTPANTTRWPKPGRRANAPCPSWPGSRGSIRWPSRNSTPSPGLRSGRPSSCKPPPAPSSARWPRRWPSR